MYYFISQKAFHAMGLYHSFSDKGNFTLEKTKTDNIMDYSDTRKHIWLWQWKQLWKNKGLKKQQIIQ